MPLPPWDARKLVDGSISIWIDGRRIDFPADGSDPTEVRDGGGPLGGEHTDLYGVEEFGRDGVAIRATDSGPIYWLTLAGGFVEPGSPQNSNQGSQINEILPGFPGQDTPDFTIRRDRIDWN